MAQRPVQDNPALALDQRRQQQPQQWGAEQVQATIQREGHCSHDLGFGNAAAYPATCVGCTVSHWDSMMMMMTIGKAWQ
jgi:hypothetical protein